MSSLRLALLVGVLLLSCADERIDPFDDPDRSPCVPDLALPGTVTVNEGASTTIDITLVGPPYTCGMSGHFYVYDSMTKATDALVLEPTGMALSASNPTGMVTITALPDDDAVDATFVIDWYIPGAISGESPVWGVDVIDGEPDPP